MLDSQTALILTAVLFGLLPALVWWVTGSQHDAGVVWWCAGSVAAGLGITLMAVRPWVAPWLSYQGGNGLILSSLLLWAQSLRSMQGRPWPAAAIGLAVALVVAYYSVLLETATPAARGVGVRLALGVLAWHVAWQAAQLARRWRSHNAWTLALTYAVLGLGLLGQMVLHGSGGSEPNPFSKTWDASTLAALVLVTATLGHFAYAGMVLDRLKRQRLQALNAQTAAEETTRLDLQLRQQDRQRRMVLVSGALAHELNQPLTAALTHAQVAQRRLRSETLDLTALRTMLDKLAAAIWRASGILERIRASGQSQTLALARLDLRETVQASLDLLQPSWRQLGVRVEVAWGDGPLWCLGDAVSLSQVLVNLLRNATQAMEPLPQRRLCVALARVDGHVQVVVSDHGPGVPAEVLAQWGEPFVSGHPLHSGQGLGLGLAISRAIVAQHQGQLSLRNQPGGGAEAVLSLPLAPEVTP